MSDTRTKLGVGRQKLLGHSFAASIIFAEDLSAPRKLLQITEIDESDAMHS